MASIDDPCLHQLLHWCLKNGDFLILYLHLLAGILSRGVFFPPLPLFFVGSTTMGLMHSYVLCYNQLVIVPDVQIV